METMTHPIGCRHWKHTIIQKVPFSKLPIRNPRTGCTMTECYNPRAHGGIVIFWQCDDCGAIQLVNELRDGKRHREYSEWFGSVRDIGKRPRIIYKIYKQEDDAASTMTNLRRCGRRPRVHHLPVHFGDEDIRAGIYVVTCDDVLTANPDAARRSPGDPVEEPKP